MDPAFANAGKTPGLEMWRIENKVPVKFPKATGKLHCGDSYIFLHTIQTKSALTHNLHFWLGEETSQDEAGIAAYKTVELDEGLGGGPVQYREVQGNESSSFQALFKKLGGLEYLPGGVESGFRHVDRDAYVTRLLMVKGKRTVRVREVPLSSSSLNTGDVFILDAGMKIFIYNGATANRHEKAKGVDVANKIRNDERGARADIILLDEEPNNSEFWGALGGQINVTNPGESDSAADAAPPRLFKCSDASGFTPVSLPGNKLTKDLLNSDDVFVVDVGNKLYVWVGKGASASERRESMAHAMKYIAQNGYPSNTPIERVSDGGESPTFKAEFVMWNPPKPLSFGSRASTGVASTQAEQQIDVESLLRSKPVEDQVIDDGSGKLEVWRVEDFQKVPQDPALNGQFFGGDSYVCLYTYMKNGSEEYVIYFWQGDESSQDEKGASALLAKELDDSLGDRPMQVRVTQGKEPAHFRQLFQGSMIVHKGGKASGFKNRSEGDSIDTDGVALFHVRGTQPMNTCGIQVEEKTCRLNSADCFVLVTPTHVYSWKGRGSTDDEHTVATNIGSILASSYNGVGGREIVQVQEGSEPEEFWTPLGGPGEYACVREGEPMPKNPRLFHCSNATGAFRVEEVTDFEQEDLIDEDVMILDCFTSIFVWVGSQAHAEEKAKAMQFAQEFAAKANDGRDADVPIMRVAAGSEPFMFTSQFVGWDAEFAKKNMFLDPYEAKMRALQEEKAKKEAVAFGEAAPAPAPVAAAAAAPIARSASGLYSREQLTSGPIDGVDPSRKEEFLLDAEFQTLFNMSKAEFAALPKWKQQAQKKNLGLF
jgi:hypothetical protein